MANDLLAYEWECPFCGQTSQGLSRVSEFERGLVANMLLAHVRQTSGNGHGPEWELPPGLNQAVARAYVTVTPVEKTQ